MRVLITGASGFIGSYIVPALRGHELVLLSRNPEKLNKFEGKKVKFVPKDLEKIVKREKPDVVINLLGILKESGEDTFERVHYQFTKRLVDGAKSVGCKLFVQMSALGCSLKSRSAYKRTKAQAEQYIRESGLRYAILKPSIVMGKGQLLFEDLRKISFLTPVIFVPKFKVQPINVRDVRDFVVKVVSEGVSGDFELCGGKVVSMKELFEFVLNCLGRKRVVVEVPREFLKPIAILGIGITLDQYYMLDVDNVCRDNKALELLGRLREGLVCE